MPMPPSPLSPPRAPPLQPAKPELTLGRRLRRFGYRYCGTMFLEDSIHGKSLSFGRTSAICLLVLCMVHWAHGTDVAPGCLQTLTALLAYNLATKGVVLGQSFIASRTPAAPADPPDATPAPSAPAAAAPPAPDAAGS